MTNIDVLKSITNLIGMEAGNLAGANVNGYKKKTGGLSSSGDSFASVGNDFYTKTNFSQGPTIPTGGKTDMAVQGEGFFVLFDDSASASFDLNVSLTQLNTDKRFDSPITSGSFTVNGFTVNVNAN